MFVRSWEGRMGSQIWGGGPWWTTSLVKGRTVMDEVASEALYLRREREFWKAYTYDWWIHNRKRVEIGTRMHGQKWWGKENERERTEETDWRTERRDVRVRVCVCVGRRRSVVWVCVCRFIHSFKNTCGDGRMDVWRDDKHTHTRRERNTFLLSLFLSYGMEARPPKTDNDDQ